MQQKSKGHIHIYWIPISPPTKYAKSNPIKIRLVKILFLVFGLGLAAQNAAAAAVIAAIIPTSAPILGLNLNLAVGTTNSRIIINN